MAQTYIHHTSITIHFFFLHIFHFPGQAGCPPLAPSVTPPTMLCYSLYCNSSFFGQYWPEVEFCRIQSDGTVIMYKIVSSTTSLKEILLVSLFTLLSIPWTFPFNEFCVSPSIPVCYASMENTASIMTLLDFLIWQDNILNATSIIYSLKRWLTYTLQQKKLTGAKTRLRQWVQHSCVTARFFLKI